MGIVIRDKIGYDAKRKTKYDPENRLRNSMGICQHAVWILDMGWPIAIDHRGETQNRVDAKQFPSNTLYAILSWTGSARVWTNGNWEDHDRKRNWPWTERTYKEVGVLHEKGWFMTAMHILRLHEQLTCMRLILDSKDGLSDQSPQQQDNILDTRRQQWVVENEDSC